MFGAFKISKLHFAGKLGERSQRLLLFQKIFRTLLIWDLIEQLQLLLHAFELGVAQKPFGAWMSSHGDQAASSSQSCLASRLLFEARDQWKLIDMYIDFFISLYEVFIHCLGKASPFCFVRSPFYFVSCLLRDPILVLSGRLKSVLEISHSQIGQVCEIIYSVGSYSVSTCARRGRCVDWCLSILVYSTNSTKG